MKELLYVELFLSKIFIYFTYIFISLLIINKIIIYIYIYINLFIYVIIQKASNAVGDIVELQKLIKRKTRKPIKILKAERKNESIVSFLVENIGHAKNLLALSGIKFNGNTVTFAIQNRKGITTSSDIKNSISVIENLKHLIIGRYNPEAQYLNLENINNDPILGDKRGLVDLNKSEKLGQVLCKLIKENFPDVIIHININYKLNYK